MRPANPSATIQPFRSIPVNTHTHFEYIPNLALRNDLKLKTTIELAHINVFIKM